MQTRTVLVLGAGSSAEFNLPAGEGLAKRIAARTYFWFDDTSQLTNGDQDLYRALRNRFSASDAVLSAGRRISEGLPIARSIDDYLYNHGHDPVVVATGKAAIVQSILEAEAGSTLMALLSHQPHISARALTAHADTWIYKLFSFLQTGVRLADVGRIFDGLSIINFNYDRCVETFLYHALQRAYGIDQRVAAEVMSTLDITHPYGRVGQLRWQDPAGRGVDYGERPQGESLLSLADQIKTFTEQAHDEAEKQHWRTVIEGCKQLVFLGFGFHRQNIDLLSLINGPENPPEIYATTYKTSRADEDVFRSRLHQLMATYEPHLAISSDLSIEFTSGTCTRMIGDYGLKLFS